MAIPILMDFCSFVSNCSTASRKIDDVQLFPTVYHRIYCRKFLTLSNQTSCFKIKCIRMVLIQQGGQVALKRSPEFCLKLTNRYLLKADHVPGDPGAGPFWGPRGIIYTNLLEVHKVMLHTKYQCSRLYGFRQEDFLCFSLYKPK